MPQVVDILSVDQDVSVEALLYDSATEEHVSFCETAWLEDLLTYAGQINDQHPGATTDELLQLYLQHNLYDKTWNWRSRVDRAKTDGDCQVFSIALGSSIEGMMCIQLEAVGAKIETDSSLIMVEKLATAPWNRVPPYQAKRYKYVGHVLVAAAVERSLELQCGGRIGLYSLPAAEDFYRVHCGMTPVDGEATPDGWQYFELTEAAAALYLSE